MPSMRTNFPPTEAAPSARASLRRAMVLSVLLVVVWSALALLPEPTDPAAVEGTAQRTELPLSTSDPDGTAAIGSGAAASGRSVSGPDNAFQLVRPGYLFVVLFLAAAGLGALWLRKRQTPGSPIGELRPVGRLSLGPQQQLQLVRVGDEVLLLGTAPQGVTLIKAYPASQFPAAAPAGPADPGLFARLLASMPKPSPRDDGEDDHEAPAAQDDADASADLPEWSIATASAISDGPDFMHVLRRYAGRKSYKANTLYPPSASR